MSAKKRESVGKKREKELAALANAEKCLREIFGKFHVDENQTDRPDAAIVTTPCEDGGENRRIGIEITTVDPENALEYYNEEKSIESLNRKRIDAHLRGEVLPAQLAKKAVIGLPKEYISDGVMSKEGKYHEYHQNGDFDQLVLIASSEFLEVDDDLLRYHSQWANYLLSEAEYPYDYVILVLEKVGKCMLIYDRQRPSTKEPEDDMAPTVGFWRSGFMPMGRGNLGLSATPPAIEMRRKKKR